MEVGSDSASVDSDKSLITWISPELITEYLEQSKADDYNSNGCDVTLVNEDSNMRVCFPK